MDIRKILFVSDLDGTLLRSDATLSEYTKTSLNGLFRKGVNFTCATARSCTTASRILKDLELPLPMITYNGAITVDLNTGKPVKYEFLDSCAEQIIACLVKQGLSVIAYSVIDGMERFSFVPILLNRHAKNFLATRLGKPDDLRPREVTSPEQLADGRVFYIACIEDKENMPKLRRFCEDYQEFCRCVISGDVYSDSCWLEFMPKNCSKSSAALALKKQLGCEKLVVFGDGENDLDLFSVADECYAVGNAVLKLKNAATSVIKPNDSDGVAHFLEQYFAENG